MKDWFNVEKGGGGELLCESSSYNIGEATRNIVRPLLVLIVVLMVAFIYMPNSSTNTWVLSCPAVAATSWTRTVNGVIEDTT